CSAWDSSLSSLLF
nr:immunoglobulin light chain junction region [Macaca mulatta]MPO03252.1 immunoglobulin light chain junction region [Macaca mulatta]MPO03262.1 immunoglobulin light chain junction region [Macaca mulatta]MPO03549.1 immunoglobulin light chain junction region [Macaca mulatta]MPO03563.1 immunoglobulin light chain junction region [Macaca mulatta]